MDNFLSLTLRDKELFNYYYGLSNFLSYEYLFSSLYIWRNFCDTKYIIIDESLIVWKHEECTGSFFMMPYNYKKENLNHLIETLLAISKEEHNKLSLLNFDDNMSKKYCNNKIYLLGDIEDQFIDDIKSNTNFSLSIEELRDDFEYVYLTKDLINLSGKKYHSKKNHYNSFKTSYNYRVTEINSPLIISDCLDLLDRWHEKNTKVLCCMELSSERGIIEETLNHLDELSLKSIAVYVDSILVGFSIGEKYNSTAIIHFERCDINYKGIYAFINREFLIREFSDTTYVNRQEDCGDIGLRKSKQSYLPITMIKKSFISIEN